MNILEVQGDITHCPEGINVIIHQANINRKMASGVAKAICDKWPVVRKTDLENQPDLISNFLGTVSFCEVELNPLTYVFNLYGQSLYWDSLAGCRTDYNAVVRGFSKIKVAIDHLVENEFNPVIGIPKYMGCDLAGGNWEIYYKIIEQTFIDTDTKIVIVNFGKTITR